MARRRGSRAKITPKTDTASPHSTPASTRALRTLPSAASTQRLACTPSKITELLDHAHHHVDLAMRLGDDDSADNTTRSDDDDWPSMASTTLTQGLRGFLSNDRTVAKKTTLLLRVLLRKKQRVVRLTGKPVLDNARYNRLKQGYETVVQHLEDTNATRKGLEEALTNFRKHALAMESALPPEPRDSRLMMTSLQACFAQTAGLVDELLTTLSQDVATQTQAKGEQLAAFKDTLDRRERLSLDTAIAKQQLGNFQKLKIKKRSAIPGAYDLELAQRKHEYMLLRRRLASMTAAMEHVFQFHAHLDACIVNPEMNTTHLQLTRFFEKHARGFEKNIK